MNIRYTSKDEMIDDGAECEDRKGGGEVAETKLF